MNKLEFDKIWNEDLDFCGCDNPEDALKVIRFAMTIIDNRSKYWDKKKEKSNKKQSVHEKRFENTFRHKSVEKQALYLILIYVLDSSGLIEHNSSVSGARLTTKGKELLKFIK